MDIIILLDPVQARVKNFNLFYSLSSISLLWFNLHYCVHFVLSWITDLASGSMEDAITRLRSRRPMSRTVVGETQSRSRISVRKIMSFYAP